MQVIYTKDIVWIYRMKIAFSYENDQNGIFPMCEFKTYFIFLQNSFSFLRFFRSFPFLVS